MANHNLPQLTSTYANFVAELDGRLDDLAMWLDPTAATVTNAPVNSVRWNSSVMRWERFNGTLWQDLSSSYSININGTVGATTPNTGGFTTLNVTTSAALPTNTTIAGNAAVNVSTSQTLTNKTLTTPTITATPSGTVAGVLGYTTGALVYGDGSAQQEIVTLSRVQTLTNKTLTTPNIASIRDASGNTAVVFTAVGNANQLTLANSAAAGTPTISATGSDANVSLNLVPKGTGTIQVLGDQIATLTSVQTVTNKTLATPVLSGVVSGTVAGRLGYAAGLLSYGDGTLQRTVVSTDQTQTLTNKTLGAGSVWGGNVIAVSAGGTGNATAPVAGGVIYALSTSAYASTAAGNTGSILRSNGTASPPTWEEFSLVNHAPTMPFKYSVVAATTTDLGISTAVGNVLTGYSSSNIVNVTTTAGLTTASTTSTAGFRVGSTITGNANIPAGASVTTITSATAFTLSVAATGTNTISTTFTNTGISPILVDGVSVSANDRVLVKDTATLGGLSADTTLARLNGIYTVTSAGDTTNGWVLTRSLDADTVSKLDAAIVSVTRGGVNSGRVFNTTLTTNSILGSTPIYWYASSTTLASQLGPTPQTGVGFDISSSTRLQRLIGGSVTDLVVNGFGIVTLQPTAASTYSRASTVFIAGAPVASTNATVHSPLALYIASGASRTEGSLAVGQTLAVTGSTTLSSTLAVTGSTTLSSTLGVTGNTTIGGSLSVTGVTTLSSINFTPTLGQKLTFWSTPSYGIGLQNSTVYTRSSGRFSWYRNGVHADAQNDAGGGIVAMTLDQSSNLTVGGAFFGAGTGLTGTAAGLNIGGNAATVTDGVTISGTQTITGVKTFTQQITGSTNSQVSLTGDQTIAGIKTFSSPLVASGGVTGNVTGNAGTVTNGVYTTGDQTIGGVKTFISLVNANSGVNVIGNVSASGIMFATSGRFATNNPSVAMYEMHLRGFVATAWRLQTNGTTDLVNTTGGGVPSSTSLSVTSAGALSVPSNITTTGGQLRANTITNALGTGAPNFPNGITVPADSFSFAQLQNIPTATILGRFSAGMGDVEALSRATVVNEALSELAAIELNARGSGDRVALIDFHSAGTPLSGDFNARIIKNSGANSSLDIVNTGVGGITLTTGGAGLFMNGLPSFACRAWVNFNGTGTVAIRASGNVSSITDNGTGHYTVNFTTAMPDANYCATISSAEDATGATQGNTEGHGKVIAHTPSSCGVVTLFHVLNVASRWHDSALISVAIFR